MSNLGYVQWYPANPLSHGTCDYLVGDGRCGRPAEWVRKWQTQVMPAPSYWYFCDDHANVLNIVSIAPKSNPKGGDS